MNSIFLNYFLLFLKKKINLFLVRYFSISYFFGEKLKQYFEITNYKIDKRFE
jgi:hypothetical protein